MQLKCRLRNTNIFISFSKHQSRTIGDGGRNKIFAKLSIDRRTPGLGQSNVETPSSTRMIHDHDRLRTRYTRRQSNNRPRRSEDQSNHRSNDDLRYSRSDATTDRIDISRNEPSDEVGGRILISAALSKTVSPIDDYHEVTLSPGAIGRDISAEIKTAEAPDAGSQVILPLRVHTVGIPAGNTRLVRRPR